MSIINLQAGQRFVTCRSHDDFILDTNHLGGFDKVRDSSRRQSAAKGPPQPQSRDLLQFMLGWKQSILFGIVIRTKSVSAFQY